MLLVRDLKDCLEGRIFLFAPHFMYSLLPTVAAARALMSVDDMSAEEVASRAMHVAASMCVHTNTEFIVHTLDDKGKIEEAK